MGGKNRNEKRESNKFCIPDEMLTNAREPIVWSTNQMDDLFSLSKNEKLQLEFVVFSFISAQNLAKKTNKISIQMGSFVEYTYKNSLFHVNWQVQRTRTQS